MLHLWHSDTPSVCEWTKNSVLPCFLKRILCDQYHCGLVLVQLNSVHALQCFNNLSIYTKMLSSMEMQQSPWCLTVSWNITVPAELPEQSWDGI